MLEVSSDITDVFTKILEWVQVFQNVVHQEQNRDEEEQQLEVAKETVPQKEAVKTLNDNFTIEGFVGSYLMNFLMR